APHLVEERLRHSRLAGPPHPDDDARAEVESARSATLLPSASNQGTDTLVSSPRTCVYPIVDTDPNHAQAHTEVGQQPGGADSSRTRPGLRARRGDPAGGPARG